MAILNLDRVTSGYGELEILHGVSIMVEEKQIVSIIGPNGAGKSTLLKTIMGLLTPHHGKIVFKGELINGLEPGKIVRKGICYVPQSENIFSKLTILENLEMGAYIREDDFTKSISEVFNLFPILEQRKSQKAGTLSGGEQKMLAIGMSLMLNPKLLLLDEPSSRLAPQMVKTIFEKIKQINAMGTTLLIVEQNARKALAISDYGYVLEMGRNKLENTGKTLLRNEEVARLYLGTEK